MCGIAGFYNSKISIEEADSSLHSMLKSIQHRGPDDFGTWHFESISLGHRRLAIHDLTEAGHQPMASPCGRYEIIFNGEIYNFENLRRELRYTEWRGHSDTEVMLVAISEWGIESALKKFNGMFSFALWDKKKQNLTLARDRFGEKPLYYYYKNGVFVFASEVKCFEALDNLELKIDRSALTHHLETSYIPAPLSVYTNVKKIIPGGVLTFSPINGISESTYWQLSEQIEKAKLNLFTCEKEAINVLDETLKRAVKLRMASDVPLGGFLSGGVDSSLVVALMQSQSIKPVNTFSIGFDVPGYNEAKYAKKVANFLGTNHSEQYLSPQDALDIIPKLGGMFDEPFSDSSQIPTYLVSAMAKKQVTVCLSGDGGDELFSGYRRYQMVPDLWRKLQYVPFRKTFAKAIEHAPVNVLEKLLFYLKPYVKKFTRGGELGPKIKLFGELAAKSEFDELYKLTLKHWKNAPKIVVGGFYGEIWKPECSRVISEVEQMMYQDSIAYLPGDILTKVDRTAMAVSLEGRIPLLDPAVAEVAWRMPLEMKQKGECGKWALKQVLYKYLPQEMMDRPKMGFAIPIHLWLRSELKEWATDLLSVERLNRQGLYRSNEIFLKLKSHLNGEENNSAYLWDVLMVQSWLDADPKREKRL
jgi:asparagine synthase (glutamine-hydrolysing)